MLLDKILAYNLSPRSSPANVDIDFIPVLNSPGDDRDTDLRVVMITVLGQVSDGVRYIAKNLSPAHVDGCYERCGAHPDYNVRIE